MARPLTTVPQHYHKPVATRTLTLAIYLIATCGLLVLIELACQKIPNHTGTGSFEGLANYTDGYLGIRAAAQEDLSRPFTLLEPRQETKTDESQTTTEIPSSVVVPVSSPSGSGSSKIMSTRTSSFFMPTGVASSAHNGFLTLGDNKITSTSTPSTSIVVTSAQNEFLTPTGDNETPTQTPSTVLPTRSESAPNGYLIIGSETMTSTSTASATLDGLVTTETSALPTSTTICEARGSTTIFSVVELGEAENTAPGSGSVTYTTIETVVEVSFCSKVATTSQTSRALVTTSKTVASAVEPTETVVNSAGTFLLMSDGTVERAPQITFRQYMTVAFLPLILAVVFTFPWRILDTTIREMEPYYQLQNPEGVNAKNSILLDYTTSYFITTPFKSIYRRHYYVFSSALISIAVLIIAPLSSEALFVSLSGDCGINKSGPCHATWGIYPTLARAMEAILAFISLLVLAMMILNSRRHSGVYANPLSIAGLGTLFQNPATLGEFSSINSRVGDDGLKAILAQRKYNLSSMKDSSETSYYGIINISAKEDIDSLSTFGGDVRGKYSVVNSTEELRTSSGFRIKNSSKGRNDRWAWMLETLLHSSAFLLIAGLLALVTYYHWTSGDTGFERFMDSQEFGVKFLMTVVGVIIKLFWANIDEDLRRTEPYRRLLEGSAKPEDSILVYTYMSPISALASSLVRRHYLTSLISFVALLSEILPIALANIPFSPAATREAYSVCTYIAMAVLAIMILTLVLFVIFRHTRARHLHHLPRQPVTIASTLVYLATETRDHRGSMIESLAGLVFVGAKERDTMVRAMGRRYGMGRIGEADLRIDDEDRISRY